MRRVIEAALFVGPSLTRLDLAGLPPEVEVLPPAAQGDIYRLTQFRPQVIGLIDGFFHSVPAIWHKEVLWALAEGTIVLGAASMGALRAVELAPYGMHGVGRVFEQFTAGHLTDDDEVAIVHGPPELGYPAASEAMVNLRATLRLAKREGVLDSPRHDHLVALAKARPFWERSFDALFADAAAAGQPLDRAAERWIRDNRIDQKRRDAQELVAALVAALRDGPGADRPPFTFQRTTMWQDVCYEHMALDDTPLVGVRQLLEELALRGQQFARRAGVFPVSAPEPQIVDPVAAPRNDRREQGHDLWMRTLVGRLKAAGLYEDLRDSALAKRAVRLASGASRPAADPEAALAAHFAETGDSVPWFIEGRPGSRMESLAFWRELDAYARSLGMLHCDDFLRVVIRDRQLRAM